MACDGTHVQREEAQPVFFDVLWSAAGKGLLLRSFPVQSRMVFATPTSKPRHPEEGQNRQSMYFNTGAEDSQVTGAEDTKAPSPVSFDLD